MTDPVEPLILDLLEWLAPGPRLYSEVLETWRTSCPRLPVWEEANARGYIDHQHEQGREAYASLTADGRAYLHAKRGNHPGIRLAPRNQSLLAGTGRSS